MIQADIPLIDSCSVLSELRLITEKLSIKCSTLLSGKTFKRNSLLVDRMAPSKCYGTTAFALVTILVIFAMFASVSSCTDRARYSGGDDYLVFGAGSVHSIEGTELVIQTDNSPRYTDAGKQTRITFPSSGRIKDKLSQIKVGTRVSYSRFESVDASGSYEGNDIEIEQANTIRRC